MIIDSHQHFWDPERGDCGWMTGPAAQLRRTFAPEHLRPEMDAAGVTGTILVQTRSSLDETREFLALTSREAFILGVVGWVDLTHPNVDEMLADLQHGPNGHLLVGIRHALQSEPDEAWLLGDEVQRGLSAVQEANLTFDLLVRSRELPAALRTVASFPQLRFVVDHVAKPDILHGVMEPWASLMEGFRAHRDHVWCKLSGMVTEADLQNWSRDDLQPYANRVLDIFGPDRCMFGSDWPVCTIAGSYADVLSALQGNIATLSRAQQRHILAGSSIDAYRLNAVRVQRVLSNANSISEGSA